MTHALLLFSDHCKYLGITIQSNLKWDKHIEEKIASVSCTLGLLQRNIKTYSIHIRDLAYKALVRPNYKLEYASTVWSSWQGYILSMPLRKFSLLAMFIIITTQTQVCHENFGLYRIYL